MAAFNKFNQFVKDLGDKVHNLGSDTLKVMLTNVAPSASNAVKADITEIAAGNGYTTGGNAATYISDAQAAGLYKLILNDVSFVAAGGSFATFRYAVLYNATPGAGPLIGWWDYGAAVTLTNGNTFLVDLDQVNGVLTIQ